MKNTTKLYSVLSRPRYFRVLREDVRASGLSLSEATEKVENLKAKEGQENSFFYTKEECPVCHKPIDEIFKRCTYTHLH